MKNAFFIRIINFLKENPKILYSLFIIVLIPAALSYNTFFSSRAFQKNIDFTLQNNALLLESLIGTFVPDILSQPELLQEKIYQVSKENPEIKELRIAIPEGEKFKIVAAQRPQEIGLPLSGDPLFLAWSKNQAIAYLKAKEKERFWEVIKPIEDSTGKKIAIVSLSLSLQKSDQLIRKTIFHSYLITLVAIIFALFLIIQHTKLFGYVKLSQELEKVDKAKDEFIRIATHELQSPIANIRGYILTLKEEIKDLLNETQKEYFERINLSAKNLSDLISDILEVSRIEQGRLEFTPQRIDPQVLIREVVEGMKMRAQQKNLFLELIPNGSLAKISVNPNRFRQILTNLLENALKYTFKGGITIKTIVDKMRKRYIIEIADTGIGIPAEHQSRLFEKFYRVKTRETAGIPGTGLGLWITRQLTEKMGGKIFIESLEKVGTKFILYFPIVE